MSPARPRSRTSIASSRRGMARSSSTARRYSTRVIPAACSTTRCSTTGCIRRSRGMWLWPRRRWRKPEAHGAFGWPSSLAAPRIDLDDCRALRHHHRDLEGGLQIRGRILPHDPLDPPRSRRASPRRISTRTPYAGSKPASARNRWASPGSESGRSAAGCHRATRCPRPDGRFPRGDAKHGLAIPAGQKPTLGVIACLRTVRASCASWSRKAQGLPSSRC